MRAFAGALIVVMALAGCSATQSGMKKGAGLESWGAVWQAACYHCLKPRTDGEREYLERIRDSLTALIGETR